jgi:hypothetical protein
MARTWGESSRIERFIYSANLLAAQQQCLRQRRSNNLRNARDQLTCHNQSREYFRQTSWRGRKPGDLELVLGLAES